MGASGRYWRVSVAATLAMAVLPAMGARPGSAQAVGEVRAAGENYRLGDDVRSARGRDVPGLAVDPADSRHLVAVDVELNDQVCEYSVSFDTGRTWTGSRLAVPEGFSPPCRSPGGTAYPAADQSVAFGSGQNVYTTFSSNRAPEGDSVLVAKSTDGGRSFGPSVVVIPGGPAGNPFHARPKLAVHIGGGPGGADIVFVSAWLLGPSERQAVTIRSEDSGATWKPQVRANAPGTATAPRSAREQTQPVVAPDGAVYVAFRIAASRSPGPIVVARSEDRGQTWIENEVRSITDDPNLELAVDPRNGTVYLAYNEMRSGDIDVFLQRLVNWGGTWSAPLRVNDDPAGTGIVQHLPDLSVAPNGRLDVVWHDRRHAYKGVSFPACPYFQRSPYMCQGDVYYAYSTDGGLNFSRNRRITDRTINLDIGYDRRLETYTSYTPVSVPIGNDSVLFAWADSREGNYDNDSQDIYLARVDLQAGSAIPVVRLPEATGPGYASALSRRAYPGGLEAVANVPSSKAILVNEGDTAAALAGAVLARANYGSVLVAPPFGLPGQVRSELVRMGVTEALLLGDENALGSRVVDDVKAAMAPVDRVTRLAGPDPATTALLIARALDTRTTAERSTGVAPFAGAVIVNPASGEASAAASLAAALRFPVLFVDRDSVPASTAQALSELAIPATLVIGGTDVVSDAVAARLPAPRRVAGGGVAGTSVAVAAEALARGGPSNVVYVGDSDRPMDAAILGAAVARLGGIMLLTPGADTGEAERAIDRLGVRSAVDRIVVARSSLGAGPGYRLVAGDGGVFSFGSAPFLGGTGGTRLNRPVVGAAETASANGYWLVAADGGVFAFGDARFRGSTGAIRLAKPIVGMAANPSGNGYWLVASDGGVFAFGDARFRGSAAPLHLNSAIVGIASTPSGNGYWLVASDGGVFAFGDAQFRGSTGALKLKQPVVGIARSPSGLGYRLVASDGGVFAFGDARFHGSTGAMRLNRPVVGISGTTSGNGYWLSASDGGVFAFGDARFLGSTGSLRLTQPVVGMATG